MKLAQHTVETRPEFTPGIGRGAPIEGKTKAAAVGVGLSVSWGAEALRLDRGIGRDTAEGKSEAIAAFDAPTERLRVEAGGEMVAGKGKAIGRHPVIGEVEGCGDISRA